MMEIGRIRGCTRVLGRSQGYYGLPVRDELQNDSVTGADTPVMITAWFPSPDELAALNAGAAIHLSIVGTAHPPVMVGVGGTPDDERQPADQRRTAGQVPELHRLRTATPLLWTDCGHGYIDEWRAEVEGGNYAVWGSAGQAHLESTWTARAPYPSIEHAQLVAQHHHDLRTISIELAKEIRQLEFDADHLVDGPALDAARTMLRHSANRLRALLAPEPEGSSHG